MELPINNIEPDFEVEQIIKINDLLHKIAKTIGYNFNLFNKIDQKKLYHISLNWFMFQLGIKKKITNYLLYGLTHFDYRQLYVDIYNYCNGEYSMIDIEVKFQTINMSIKSECQIINEYLLNYKPVKDYNIVKINYDEYSIIKLIIDKRYNIKKCQYIESPTSVKINNNLYDKLKKLLLLNNKNISEVDEKIINLLIFVVMYRYKLYELDKVGVCLSVENIYNNNIIKKKLNMTADNTLELFANPMNSHLENFCSLFYDIEKYFGSIGNAFFMENNMEYWKKYNTVICNPPYCEQIMERMSKMIENIIEYCKKENHNILFIITIPDWRNVDGSKKEVVYSKEYKSYDMLKKYIKIEIEKNNEYEYFDYFNYQKVSLNNTGTLILIIDSKQEPNSCVILKDDFI
jgi:hypothetical protein